MAADSLRNDRLSPEAQGALNVAKQRLEQAIHAMKVALEAMQRA